MSAERVILVGGIVLGVIVFLISSLYYKSAFNIDDANKNGKFDGSEIRMQLNRFDLSADSINMADELFNNWDTNKDALLETDEFPLPAKLFDLISGDDDPIDVKEFRMNYGVLRATIDDIQRSELGWYELLDIDSNSELDQVEGMGLVVFEEYDLNDDGVVTLAEAQQSELPPSRWQALIIGRNIYDDFGIYDRDDSDQLDADELGSEHLLIESMDRNRDDRVSRDELEVILELSILGPDAYDNYKWHTMFIRRDTSGQGWINYDQLGQFYAWANQIDSNNDQRVTLEEFMAIPDTQYQSLIPAPMHAIPE